VVIAQDSGNRYNESHLALNLAWLEAEYGVTVPRFDHLTLAIRNFRDSGNPITPTRRCASTADTASPLARPLTHRRRRP
jgi:hypothetical protein